MVCLRLKLETLRHSTTCRPQGNLNLLDRPGASPASCSAGTERSDVTAESKHPALSKSLLNSGITCDPQLPPVTAITSSCDLNHRSPFDSPVSKNSAFFRAPTRRPQVRRPDANLFKDLEHLVRLAVVIAIALVAFVLLRAAVVPRSFGEYGHYRGAAIGEIAAGPIAHAGHEVCEGCHTDVVDQKKLGKHVVVSCEACHGPQAKHADDPASIKPQKLDTTVICARCHEANSAKPKGFPQVATAEHSAGLACDTCHQPHRPKIEADTKAARGAKK
jgi:cytochrome c554/c'-like protein